MKVHIVTLHHAYDGENIESVYLSFESAKKFVEDQIARLGHVEFEVKGNKENLFWRLADRSYFLYTREVKP